MCVCSGNSVEKQLAELETLCKQKEEERVELELRLTEVKENLKKSLARGALGPPTDTKISVKVGSKHTSVYSWNWNSPEKTLNEFTLKYIQTLL